MKEMTSANVLEIVDLLESNGINVWLDGGWGVDALLGKQTRTHGDLDIVVQHRDVPRLRQLLGARGYRGVLRNDTKDWNFVLGDDDGHEVDVHSYSFDSEGKHVYGIEYPADSLTGVGSVNGRAVKCITAEHMVRFRTGYKLREVDIQDVRALHERFGIPIPKEHEDWLKRKTGPSAMSPHAQGRPFYHEYAWAYDYLIERPVPKDCAGIAALMAVRGVLPPSSLLDAGCGTGRYTVELAARGFRVTGLDLSSELIEQARRRQSAGAAFEVGNLLELKSTAPYDGILCRGVLNDLIKEPERRSVLRVFARALRPGGVLVLDVREWQGTARRKTREPVFEKSIDTPCGRLRFRSVTTLDQVNHQLLVNETHELRTNRSASSAKFEFTMRCWTREELALLLAEAGFASGEYSGGYDPTAPAGESDRLVVVATHP